MEADDSVYEVFHTVEILQSVAKHIPKPKDLSNFAKITHASRDAVEWERSLRNTEPKVVLLGHHGPLPNFHKATLVTLVVSTRLRKAHLPYIKTIFQEATRNSKKVVLEFPYKYPDLGKSAIAYFKQLKHPIELKIAEQDLHRSMLAGLKFGSAYSLITTFNRVLYIGLEVLSYDPDEWNLDVIKSIVPLKNLKQFTATSSITQQIFLRRNFPQLRGLCNVTDLTVDEFEHPLIRLDKSVFPQLTKLKLIDPILCDNVNQTAEDLKRGGYQPCPVKSLTIEYWKSKHPMAEFADLMIIFPQLAEVTINGNYLPYAVFSLIQDNLSLRKLCLFGSVIFGSLTTIMEGDKTFKGIRLMKGLKFLELGTRSTYQEKYDVIADSLAELKGLQKIYLHKAKLKIPLVQILTKRFKCVEVEPDM